jgi:PLP dependent protein
MYVLPTSDLFSFSHGIAAIPSLYCVQTLTSEKAATGLNKSLPESRADPLNVFLQVNTSGEDSKSGLAPLTSSSDTSSSELVHLATHILNGCPRLHLLGLMTIGSLAESLTHDKPNRDFETLKETQEALQEALAKAKADGKFSRAWGAEDGRLLLSMGMSSDFEDALKAGSDVVRVGTGIFGARKKKEEMKTLA